MGQVSLLFSKEIENILRANAKRQGLKYASYLKSLIYIGANIPDKVPKF